jgi:hypothetical protein
MTLSKEQDLAVLRMTDRELSVLRFELHASKQLKNFGLLADEYFQTYDKLIDIA